MKFNFFFLFFSICFYASYLKAEDQKPTECGTLLSTVMQVNPAINHASLIKFFFSDTKFCDLGTNEQMSNFEVQLLDKENNIINKKSVFLNTFEVVEVLNSNNPTRFEASKIVKTPQYRVVKFSITGSPKNIKSYKVISILDKKVFGIGSINEKL